MDPPAPAEHNDESGSGMVVWRSREHKVTVAYHKSDMPTDFRAKLQIYATSFHNPNPSYEKAVRVVLHAIRHGPSSSLLHLAAMVGRSASSTATRR